MFQIVPISIEHTAGFRAALDVVARERIYLGHIEARSMEWAEDFVSGNIKNNHAQFVALDNGAVIGWCDIIPRDIPGFGHTGVLGMGVVGNGVVVALAKRSWNQPCKKH
ncbi:MAG: hypothetical protein HY066_09775 [Betaproteobacteria bacterium]|nr:hypothetical protein [Betaproteobacteria bacterium]